jgi:hypothetical protein
MELTYEESMKVFARFCECCTDESEMRRGVADMKCDQYSEDEYLLNEAARKDYLQKIDILENVPKFSETYRYAKELGMI